MTADRDRLAKLMDETPFDYDERRAPDGCTLITPDWKAFADRLIAAGVHLDIDEERLGRAMRKASTYVSTGHGHPPREQQEMWLSGALHSLDRIAAAYREDVDGG